MSNEIKKVKVRRIKEEAKEEKKLRKIKVRRLPESVEDVMRIKVIRFKKEYNDFLEVTGKCPDEFVETNSNKIALLYFKYKQGYNIQNVKRELEEIPYNVYINFFMHISYQKMDVMGIAVKYLTGANILYNLISRLIAVDDVKIKLETDMEDFYSEIAHKRIIYKGIVKEKDTKFNVTKTMERMFVIRDNIIIASGKEIDKNKDLKGSVIMVEYSFRKQFVAIPYRFYKKLLKIKYLEINFSVFADPSHNYSIDEISEIDMDKLNELDEYGEIYSYGEQIICSSNIIQHISNILEFENYLDFICKHDYITEEGLSICKDKVKVYIEGKGEKEMSYNEFVHEYLMFLRI